METGAPIGLDEAVAALVTPIARGEAVLFTGAGFSADAPARAGGTIPTGDALADELFRLLWPDDERDESVLADLLAVALRVDRAKAVALLERRLRVDAERLPERYRLWFAAPWRRIYTLNVDDLAVAAATRFALRRRLRVISALRTRRHALSARPQLTLDVICLNGYIDDAPSGITFTTTQVARRSGNGGECPYWRQLAEDLTDRSVVFVGSRLDEPPLWQHLDALARHGRRRRGAPRSFLVTPRLARARAWLLAAHGIAWVRATSAEFARAALAPIVEGDRYQSTPAPPG